MSPRRPIRVFFSPLTDRFYASAHYRIDEERNVVEITGEKYDVTQDIAAAIVKHEVTFSEASR